MIGCLGIGLLQSVCFRYYTHTHSAFRGCESELIPCQSIAKTTEEEEKDRPVLAQGFHCHDIPRRVRDVADTVAAKLSHPTHIVSPKG